MGVVNKVYETNSNWRFYSGFIKQNKLHAILHTQLLIGKEHENNIGEV